MTRAYTCLKMECCYSDIGPKASLLRTSDNVDYRGMQKELSDWAVSHFYSLRVIRPCQTITYLPESWSLHADIPRGPESDCRPPGPLAQASVERRFLYGVTSSVELDRSPGGSEEKIGADS